MREEGRSTGDQRMSALSGIQIGRVAAPLRAQVLDGLRNAILNFDLKPGERLVEREMIEQIGVSRTTIREVLRELTAEGLVVVIPQKGAVVYAPSREEAKDLYAVRASLEALAVRRFIERAPDEKVEALKKTVADFEAVSSSSSSSSSGPGPGAGDADAAGGGGDMRALLQAKDRFYDVLLEGAASPTIQQILAGVQARVRLLRATSLSQPGLPREVVAEIRDLVEAIAARDVDTAIRRCDAHLQNAAATGINALAAPERS
jgi:DNA-binding GntR family transcriptional regulator